MKNALQAVNHSGKLMEWSRQVEACRQSGMTVTERCQEHGIAVSTYYYRQRRVLEAISANHEAYKERLRLTKPVLHELFA